jgi:hypothetical protein
MRFLFKDTPSCPPLILQTASVLREMGMDYLLASAMVVESAIPPHVISIVTFITLALPARTSGTHRYSL